MNAFRDLENSFQKSKKIIVPNVGIGTTNPAEALGINGDIAFTKAADRTIRVEDSTGLSTGKNLTLLAGSASMGAGGGAISIISGGGSIHLQPGSAGGTDFGNVALVESGGSVGIGTASPAYVTEIDGTPSAFGFLLGLVDTRSYGIDRGGGMTFNGVYDSSDNRANYAGIRGLKENSTDGSYAGYLAFYSRVEGGSLNEGMRISSTGRVGIGITAPRAALDVQSGAIIGAPSVSNATSTIDFAGGNTQYTNSDCGSFQLDNLKDGGSYTFIVKGSTAATCSFTAYSGSGSGALTVHLPPDLGPTTANKHTIFSIMVGGSDVYLAWAPGY